MTMRLAFVQSDFGEGNRRGNQDRVARAAERASAEGATILALPELWCSGYDLATAVREPWGENEFSFLRNLSKQLRIAILGGSLLEPFADGYANTAVAVEGGRELARYRKLHLFRPLGEHMHLRAGSSMPQVFSLRGIRCAITICYDLRFPEVYRPARGAGVELFFIPAQWPRPRIHQWRALLIARAIENQCYTLGVNRRGWYGDVEFAGNSLFLGPGGEVLTDAGEGEGIFFGDIDPARVAEVRRDLPVFEDCRRDLLPPGEGGGGG